MASSFWKKLTGRDTASRRPLNTSFRQQRLRAWQPTLSPQNALPMLIVLITMFVPIGIGLLISAINVQDITIRYDKCQETANGNGFTTIPEQYVSTHFKTKLDYQPRWMLINGNGATDESDICRLNFQIPNILNSPIYIYYKLTNFYQNHRVYIESYDLDQLKGSAVNVSTLDKNCDPLKKDNVTGKVIYPCGLVANSLFNDTFGPILRGISGSEDFILTNNNTASSTDKHRYRMTEYNASDIVPPPNWAKRFPDGYNETNIPNLHTWQEFQVWMRNAALPTFYKKILQNESSPLPNGNYSIDIVLNYPVHSFNGTKTFVLTTNSVIGAKNIWLGIVYLMVAGICVLFSLIFLLNIIFQTKKLEDHQYLSNVPAEPLMGLSEPEISRESTTPSVGRINDTQKNTRFTVREIL
ncbi:similar to Saccharomyces cerevisiae YCR094W CDC50 Endosomal protein that interacts with phospholipid flippase Drs2p [Maudiozyma saulgeensis]|uniref:Similar to Saccharomyces cerevisiae YCR094W CDC50 Endosomal protein that interacts with phospholipid flippase Drs2p n=1 Tax=Maudiozyma saulgeensis TaxID=1789683 RepID=A0A1X7R7G7_9SACH|nr:similar to Saccharomyces cerevisiae YCR094W CDC50 Endosomal protein that interacts with phospholipid flippase Drs2p [Kazachstania saulgeensis]